VVREMEELPTAIAAARSRSAPADALGRARELTGWLETYWRGLARGRGDGWGRGGLRAGSPRHR
jgi:hypothetical protein